MITHCPACGIKFGKRAKVTIANWFFAGTPSDRDIVHWSCRDKPRKKRKKAKKKKPTA